MTRDDSEQFDALLRAVAASPNATVLGRRVLGDRFLLRRRLGEGGFGVVYEAEDLRDGGRVALKLLRYAEADWLYRFKREFRALQGLAHPNLVAQGELFGDNDQWFFTMELVDGVDFVDYVRTARSISPVRESQASGVLSTTVALTAPSKPESASQQGPPAFDEQKLRDVLKQLFEGLVVLHAADRVHRDIKPSNVLVTHDGRVVLIDFGLVTDSFHTTVSGVVGTPAYMAPEQAASQEVGPAADLYAVGVMLYEVLTGAMPIDGAPLQILIDKQSREPVPPASIAEGIPEDLNALCVKLLHFDPARRPSAVEVVRSLEEDRAPRSTAVRGSVEPPTFVGRRAELGMLRTAFEMSSGGQLATVLVCGESGIGKSYLVRHFTEQLVAARPDTILLEGRCHEREAIPYKTIDGIVDALSRRLSHMPASEVAALLPTQRAMLARLFPVMLRVPQMAKEYAKVESVSDALEMRQSAFLALRDLFTRVAMHRPTVMVVDDLQWADDDGLKALAEILRLPDSPPLLFVGTLRVSPSTGDGALERLRTTFPGNAKVINLSSLGREDAQELAAVLLRRAGGTYADPERIALEAAGHPLFVEELARQIALGGSGASEIRLDDAIWSRVVQVEKPAREVAELVAVAGKPLPLEVAAAAAKLEQAEFQRGVAILRASNLVRTSGGRWVDAIEPYHDRVREAVHARLEPARRQSLHKALALAFEASSFVDPETLAMHWREAGDASQAARYAEAAGDQASRTLAFDRAAAWFEQALELLPENHPTRRNLSIRLGNALAFAGRGALAAHHFEEAAGTGPVGEALELRRRAAEELLRSGHFDRGIEASRIVLAAIGMRFPASDLQTIVLLIYYGLLVRLRGLRFRERAAEQITPSERTRMDTCWSVAMVLGFVETYVGLVFQRRALLLALSAGDLDRITRAVAMGVGFGALAGGRSWQRTERQLLYTQELANRSGSAQGRVYAAAAAGLAFHFNGRFREAAENFARTLEILEDGSTGLVHERVSTRLLMIESLVFLGRFKQLRRAQQDGLGDAMARGDLYAVVSMQIGGPNLRWLVEDRPDLAETALHTAMQRWSTRGFHRQHCSALHSHAWIALYSGDVEKGHELACELLHKTKRSLLWRVQEFRVRLLYAHGAAALAMMAARIGDRNGLLRQAEYDARAIEREKMAWMQPFSKILRAGIALREGAHDEALRGLDAAAHGFDAADMTAYGAAARDRAARLRNDESTASEIARVATLMKAEDVVAPDRMIAMLIPGLVA